ncbi:hypothetical protein SAMN06264364_11531 [Quadrisphaera granulorum]|uniref:Uncharacterized protein n=1 Tax=Quadrisphaera granulorum TaxID=317664 RepID=A0A316A874_9ACTN|nr:hypothetical protein BXY45_11531 [Quadrisphaera granulorum]SZE97179.1 hypothetical protein SAMN06264364_11531 [Quadrisphaera granulorum]
MSQIAARTSHSASNPFSVTLQFARVVGSLLRLALRIR